MPCPADRETVLQLMHTLRDTILANSTEQSLKDCRLDKYAYSADQLGTLCRDIPGFKFLGAGHFALVYSPVEHPTLAIKVGLKPEDSGAMYAAWCRANAGMPHIPEVFCIQRFTYMYMVAMPVYYSAGEIMWREDDPYTAGMWFLLKGEPVQSSTYPELHETGAAIHEFFKDVATFDLHAGNYMADDNGAPIITDPVSFTRKDKAIPETLQEYINQYEGKTA